jgi:hypothetical protein
MRQATILMCLLACGGLAADWPAIPPEVWAMKDNAARTGPGAVILEKAIHLGVVDVTFDYRIRIFSERGKSAGQFPVFPVGTVGLAGRTVLPDGRCIPFTSAKDFQTKTAVARGDWELERKRVMVPGLTDDCIVDLHWRQPLTELFSSWDSMREYFELAEPFPIKVMTTFVLSPRRRPYAYRLTPDHQTHVDFKEAGMEDTLTMRDLRAMDDLPYALRPTRDFPSLVVHGIDQETNISANRGTDEFWAVIARRMKNVHLEYLRKGGAYRALSETLRKDLPEGARARALELYRRLRGRILDLDALTEEEQAARPAKSKSDRVEARDLDAAARLQEAPSWGFYFLAYQLFKDAGLDPVLARVANRQNHFFNMKELNQFQFDDLCIVIEEQGKPALWLSPRLRLADGGYVHPDYQGTPALGIGGLDWKVRPLTVPVSQPGDNASRFTYALELTEDRDRVTCTAEYLGHPAYAKRNLYHAKGVAEQSRTLKENLERADRNFIVTRATLDHLRDPARPLAIHLEGEAERTAARRRTVTPFPFLEAPLWIPEELASPRTERIVLPFLRSQKAVCRFKLPEGQTLAPAAALDQRNAFGSVSWKAVRTGAEVEVSLDVEVETLVAPGSELDAFKAFLAWVQDATRRTLTLEKP